jgi:hypothetical protein
MYLKDASPTQICGGEHIKLLHLKGKNKVKAAIIITFEVRDWLHWSTTDDKMPSFQ